jgi:hypothetical protein
MRAVEARLGTAAARVWTIGRTAAGLFRAGESRACQASSTVTVVTRVGVTQGVRGHRSAHDQASQPFFSRG